MCQRDTDLRPPSFFLAHNVIKGHNSRTVIEIPPKFKLEFCGYIKALCISFIKFVSGKLK